MEEKAADSSTECIRPICIAWCDGIIAHQGALSGTTLALITRTIAQSCQPCSWLPRFLLTGEDDEPALMMLHSIRYPSIMGHAALAPVITIFGDGLQQTHISTSRLSIMMIEIDIYI